MHMGWFFICTEKCHDLVTLVEVFYGGDSISSDHPQSYTCPNCGKMGFTESSLQEHVSVQHCDSSTEVVSHT